MKAIHPVAGNMEALRMDPGGGVLAILGYPGMCHFPEYTFGKKF